MVVPTAKAVARGSQHTRPVILTVDDEPSVRSAVCVIFDDEYEVLEAPNGQVALDVVCSRRVDLVLLDLRMPGISGLTLLERLLTVKRDVKVILVTAVDDARTAAAAMKIGASDYLTKPFDVDELADVVRHALDVRADHTMQMAQAVVTGPQIGICTSVAVVLGARCGLTVEAVVSEALHGSDPAARHDICIDLSSFGQGLIRVARKIEAIDVRLPASFDFTGLLRELCEFLPLKPTCSRRPQDLIGRVMARVAADYRGTSVKRLGDVSGFIMMI